MISTEEHEALRKQFCPLCLVRRCGRVGNERLRRGCPMYRQIMHEMQEAINTGLQDQLRNAIEAQLRK